VIVSEPKQTQPADGAGAVRRALVKSARGFLFPAGLAMGLGVGLGGCMLATDQRDPALDVPVQYKNGPQAPDAALPALDWWRGFRSAELTRLAEEAQTVNLDIAAAKARVVQADAQARIAGAALLPGISGDFDATQSKSPRSTGTGRASDSYRAFLSASYEIDIWGKNRAAALSAEESAVASRYEADTVALTTLATVANAYFQVLAAQDRLRIAQSNIASAQRIYDAVRQRVSAGTATDLELAQQESVLNSQRAAVPSLRQTLGLNVNALATLVARPPENVNVRGGGLGGVIAPRVTPGLPSDLLLQRPDIRRAESILAATTADVGNARAQFFPSIQLTGSGGFQSAALSALFTPNATFYSLAAGVTQPVFDGFRIQSNFELQSARQDEALQNYRKAVVASFADVDNALMDIRQTSERIRLQRQVVESARRAFTLAETRFREGTIDIVTVLNTQLTLFQSQDSLVLAQLARLQAVVSLYQALGGGWQPVSERRANAP
jgi:NodT family efflux transporter outer membrane factor (OMF) lipoprotein